MQIHWKPTPTQTKALVRNEDEILYGGARGGGKTDAGMAWLLYDKDNPKYRALVIRRNADDLRDWIDRARAMYSPTGAIFKGQPCEIHFPSGAIIRTGHLRDENAYTKYQGHEYQKILIEELTHIPREGDYEKLLGSNRSTVKGIRPQVFCTTNPDGDGHDWVKERFECEDGGFKTISTLEPLSGVTKTKIFIPARVEDNPHLTEADPNYVAFLNTIKDETLRKQWREGSWEEPKVEGAYYAKQIERARHEGRITFVPHEKTIKVDTYWDLGIGDSMSIWFVQVIGNQIGFIDYLEVEGEGLTYCAKELEKKPYIYGEHFAPHDISVRELSDGKSRLEKAQALGINFIIVPKLSIDDGIDAARDIFNQCWFDKENCKEGLRALKHYKKLWDEKMQTWKDKPHHNWASHAADAFRYFAVAFRKVLVERSKETDEPFDPHSVV